jgi:CheY-like chemotaxis protein/anti-sigma regulatory factor (Ser/Thr protein kinase)
LRQVLWNLVSNAVRFAAEGGRVTVVSERAEGADARLTLRVEDDGPGIPSELLPWVFDPFRQGRPQRTRRHDGLGLGLAIAKRLVELHGGTVTAENLSPHGAAFTVTLPISVAAPGAGTTAEERELALAAHGNGGGEGTSLQGVRVLVVEDVRDSRELLETLLGACGAEVVAAESCAGALEAFLARPPDVMISDIEMPDGNGFDLIARIRALPTDRGGDVPAIALTAYAGVEHARRALASGYQAHVAKPFEGAQLLGIVEELLRGHPAPT